MVRELIIGMLVLCVLILAFERQLATIRKLEECPPPTLVGDIPPHSTPVRAARISCTFIHKCLVRIEAVEDPKTGKINYETECK